MLARPNRAGGQERVGGATNHSALSKLLRLATRGCLVSDLSRLEMLITARRNVANWGIATESTLRESGCWAALAVAAPSCRVRYSGWRVISSVTSSFLIRPPYQARSLNQRCVLSPRHSPHFIKGPHPSLSCTSTGACSCSSSSPPLVAARIRSLSRHPTFFHHACWRRRHCGRLPKIHCAIAIHLPYLHLPTAGDWP